MKTSKPKKRYLPTRDVAYTHAGYTYIVIPYYRMMNFDLAIVMYGDTSFKHTLIKTRITVRLTRITACLKSVSRVFEIHVQLLFGAKD